MVTGRRQGLHASLTRMVSFEEPDAELVSRHRAVARIDARLILESQSGNRLNAVLGSGLDQYAEEGFPEEWKLHHQGGLTGYGGREIFATPRAEHRLEANQVVAWNPSITRVKSEDTVLIGTKGPEVLTMSDSWPLRTVGLPAARCSAPRSWRGEPGTTTAGVGTSWNQTHAGKPSDQSLTARVPLTSPASSLHTFFASSLSVRSMGDVSAMS